MASFNLILPEMNTVLSHLGGADYKGFNIALFTISAGLSRPFSGKLADYIGRKKVMYIGLLVCGCISLLYPIGYSVAFVLMLRFVHGFSAGFYPTGATALGTDILPENIRGVAMGVWGTFISLGIGVGQGMSSMTVKYFGLDGIFYGSLVLVAISFLFMLRMKETLNHQEPFQWKMLALKKDEIIEPHVFPVAVVMLLSAVCSGVIFVLSPEFAEHLHIENKGSFFIYYVLATIIVRLGTGKLSDKIGRRQMLLIGMTLLTIAMVLVGSAQTVEQYTLSSIIFGIATGTSSPTIFAWTADLSPKNRRGIGAGTMFIALELGICLGALLTFALYRDDLTTIRLPFYISAGCSGLTVFYLIWHLWIAKKPATFVEEELS